MSRYVPSFVDPAQPDKSPTIVRAPSGVVFDVTDPALAGELWPQGARVIKQDRGVFDTFPLSLITTQTIDQVGVTTGARLDIQRFRPNILVEATGKMPFRRTAGWAVSCALAVCACVLISATVVAPS